MLDLYAAKSKVKGKYRENVKNESVFNKDNAQTKKNHNLPFIISM